MNRLSLVGNHKLATTNLTLWNWKVITGKLICLPFPTPMSGVGVTRKDVVGVI